MAGDGWRWLEMAGDGWRWLEMAEGACGPAKRVLDESGEKVHPTKHRGTAERERSTAPELH